MSATSQDEPLLLSLTLLNELQFRQTQNPLTVMERKKNSGKNICSPLVIVVTVVLVEEAIDYDQPIYHYTAVLLEVRSVDIIADGSTSQQIQTKKEKSNLSKITMK